ncbi:MAG: CcmD family protein [Sphingobacteriia bacterium]|nr:MAG: CcmD family protein [Sphingobacteriia bacterium]TAG31110.1 MAG: CcmD family protein [Sphingobacteriia bacterium]
MASLISFAAEAQTESSTDLMRSNGKIFVVMAVVVLILVGLFIYLFSIDKKITRLEKEAQQ